jgi:lipoprotein-anchoring transpeptidase ErfK/SrfK
MKQVINTAILLIAATVVATAAAQTPAKAPNDEPRSAQQEDLTLALQVALDRAGFSPGQIDGKSGNNTSRALRAFQEANSLLPTGTLDSATTTRLGDTFENPLSTYAISAEDAAGPFVKTIPADMVQKAKLPSLGYTSLQELLAERFHVSPALLQRLNANVEFKQGDVITVPNVEPFFAVTSKTAGRGTTDAARANTPTNDAARATNTGSDAGRAAVSRANNTTTGRSDLVITVTDATKSLIVQDSTGKTIFFAPVTVGSTRDPLPVGEWKVNGVQRNPEFNYTPDLFWDADPKHSKAKIASGPNNPVGSVWIDLSKEHYGIHGTPEPSRIGYTESHGCIRLTNWDAARLAALVAPGAKVVLN